MFICKFVNLMQKLQDAQLPSECRALHQVDMSKTANSNEEYKLVYNFRSLQTLEPESESYEQFWLRMRGTQVFSLPERFSSAFILSSA